MLFLNSMAVSIYFLFNKFLCSLRIYPIKCLQTSKSTGFFKQKICYVVYLFASFNVKIKSESLKYVQ